MQNWLNCSIVLDSDHRMQKVKQHEQSECHKICKSVEEQRKKKKNAIVFLCEAKQKEHITEKFRLQWYGLIQCHDLVNMLATPSNKLP